MYNQQERRRASDGGRAMDVETANTAAVYYTSRGECCRSKQNFFFYSRESPWGGTATNVPTKMYCCVLLRTTTKSDAGREIRQQCTIFIFLFKSNTPGGTAATPEYLIVYQQKSTAVYCCTTNKSGGGRATAGEQESNTYHR